MAAPPATRAALAAGAGTRGNPTPAPAPASLAHAARAGPGWAQQPPRGFGAARHRAPSLQGRGCRPRSTGEGVSGSPEHQALLEELQGMDAELQMERGAELAPRLSTSFLLWLSDLEAAAHGTPEGQELEELVQRLTAISLGATVVGDEGVAPPPEMLLAGKDGEGGRGEELGGILAPLAGVGALAALTPDGAERALAIVEEFGEKMVAARRDSVTSVLGRVPVSDAAMIPSVAGADQRILEVVLSMPPEAWPEVLREACTPPDDGPAPEGAGEEAGAEEEMMWTTPPRLLSAVDGEMRRLERRQEGGERGEGSAEELAAALGLPVMLGGDSSEKGERYAALAKLRGLVLEMVYNSD